MLQYRVQHHRLYLHQHEFGRFDIDLLNHAKRICLNRVSCKQILNSPVSSPGSLIFYTALHDRSTRYHTKISSTCDCIINDRPHVQYPRYTGQPVPSNQKLCDHRTPYHYEDPCNEENTSYCLHTPASYLPPLFLPYNCSIRSNLPKVLPRQVRASAHPYVVTQPAIRIHPKDQRRHPSRQSEKAHPNTAGG